jgi:hypothetical protein
MIRDSSPLRPEPAGERHHLRALRGTLLSLHKTLVDSERTEYEQAMGRIQSANHFLQLLTHDPWFAWLHPLSQLIVAMDEVLDDPKPLTVDRSEGLVRQSQALLVAAEVGAGFARHYHEALQRDPDVVLAHAEVTKVRKTMRLKGGLSQP